MANVVHQTVVPGIDGRARVTLDVKKVDNELTVIVNGLEVRREVGPGGFNPFTIELSGNINKGEENILILSLVNFRGGDTNPASLEGSLTIGGRPPFSVTVDSVQDAPEGLYALQVFLLQVNPL